MAQLEKPERFSLIGAIEALCAPWRHVDCAAFGYVERFDWGGASVDPGFKRIRVIARQCYVFSHAAIGGLPGAVEAARIGAECLLAEGLGPDGQFVSRLRSDGSVLDPTADLYDVAFGLFAMAWWYRLSGDRRALSVARSSVAHLHEFMQAPCGQGYLARAGDAGYLQQNPHMHLFEAAIFLAAFTGDGVFQGLADELFVLAETFLFDSKTGTLSEFFDADWRPVEVGGAIRVEPGHHYEWTWLLNRYGELSGQVRAFDLASRLFSFAGAYGHDRATGLIVDVVDPSGIVTGPDLRIWPNLEYLKAMVSMRERLSDGPAWSEAAIEAALVRINRYFLSPQTQGPASALPGGLWIDYIDGVSLEPKSDHVPASTLYHIIFAFTEVARHRSGHPPFSGRPW